LINVELEGIWKETPVVQSGYAPRNFLEALRKIKNNIIQDAEIKTRDFCILAQSAKETPKEIDFEVQQTPCGVRTVLTASSF
jgi:hypothetical protein